MPILKIYTVDGLHSEIDVKDDIAYIKIDGKIIYPIWKNNLPYKMALAELVVKNE